MPERLLCSSTVLVYSIVILYYTSSLGLVFACVRKLYIHYKSRRSVVASEDWATSLTSFNARPKKAVTQKAKKSLANKRKLEQ